MKRFRATIAAIQVAIVGLAVAAAANAAGRNKADGLSGRWSWVGFEQAGIVAPSEQLKGWVMAVKNDHLTIEGPSKARIEADFALDPTATPKGIDLAFFSNQTRGRTVWGIYEIRGETLRICVAPAAAKGRPRDFTATSANGCALYVFARKRF